jgi:hypothetical protein
MRVNDVRRWNHQTWTQLYEAALFEMDKVKLCALIWNAQLAILGRELEIRNLSGTGKQETAALKKALGVLRDLGCLAGLESPMERTIEFTQRNIRREGTKQESARASRPNRRSI